MLPVSPSATTAKYLALWAHDPETPGEKKQKDAKIDASWVNHEKHLTRLYLAALKPDGAIDGALNAVDLPPDVRGATWSPVADKLLVITEPPNDASDLGPAGAAWIVDAAAPAKPVRLDSVPATVGGGAWNADGSSIVFAAATPEDAPPGYDDLYALTPVTARCKAPQPHSRIRRPASRPGSLLHSGWLAHCARSRRHAQRRGPHRSRRANRSPRPSTSAPAVVSGLNTNRKQTGWVWLADAGGHPMQLCYAAKLGDACTASAHTRSRARQPPHRCAPTRSLEIRQPSPSKACSISRPTPAQQKFRSSSMSTAAPSARGKTAAIPSPTSSSATAGPCFAPTLAAPPTTASNSPRPTRTTSAAATTRT